MQRRILTVMLPLLILAGVVVGYVLGREVAFRATQAEYLARLNDADALADVGENAVRTGRSSAVDASLRRYQQVYGADAMLFDRDLVLISSSGVAAVGQGDSVRAVARDALNAVRRDSTPVVTPWRDAPMVVAAPIGGDRRVDGAAVIVWPTNELRSRILRRWLLLGVPMMVGMLVFAAVARPLVRWVLRPVRDLDETAHALASGDYAARAPEMTGPPELRRLATGFNEMADAVGEAMDRERAFVADASHHIGNVLTALRLRVELLDQHVDAPGTDLQRDALQEVDRMSEIVDRLLELAQSQASGAPSEIVDVAAEVDRRLAVWQHVAEVHHCRITRRGEPRADAMVSPGLVGQALDLLLDNACKYGEGAPISVSVDLDPSSAVITVTDLGPGLSESDLDMASGRFWRGAHHQNVPGTGLGLAVVRALVESVAGDLTISAAQPTGLSVAVSLPRVTRGRGSSAVHRHAAPTAR